MFGKNERIVDLLEAQAFERNDPFESKGCEEEAAWNWGDDKVVVRDRDDEDQTGGRGRSNSDMGVVIEAAYTSSLLMI